MLAASAPGVVACRLAVSSAMISDPLFYAAAIPAMVMLGLSKGGFTTMGLLAVPIMALVISPVQAAGIILPILVLSDIVALVSYRRSYDATTLKIMLPGAMVGIAIGWLTAAWVSENEIRLIVGTVSVLFAVNYWFRRRLRQKPHGPSVVKGSFWAVITGFVSFVSQARAAHLRRHHGGDVCHRQRGEAHPLFLSRPVRCDQPDHLGDPLADFDPVDVPRRLAGQKVRDRRIL
jgi:hypothetical protein